VKNECVTIATVYPSGKVGCVTVIDKAYADSTIKQIRNANSSRRYRTRVFRCDETKTDYEKFLEFQEKMDKEYKKNLLLQEENLLT